jgi:hypothetical protein
MDVSDRPIQVGDLVAVVKTCCPRFLEGVWIFEVSKLATSTGRWVCMYCKAALPSGMNAMDSQDDEEGGVHISWLKRIPPLEQLEGQRTEENIKEPA